MYRWASMVLMGSCVLVFGVGRAAAATVCDERAHGDGPSTIETTLAGVPAILRIPKAIEKPPIVLWHGFGPPASEQALMDALPLDDVPAVKVYLGLPLFGKRAEAGGIEALKRRQTTDFASLIFKPVVVGAAEELPSVLKALQADGCMKRGGRVGLFGFSAGGAAVLYALAERDVPIGSAVILNASTGLNASISAYERAMKTPYPWTDAARKLAQHTDAVGRARDIASGHPALLIVQGTADATLTPDLSIALDDALKPLYASAYSERLELVLAKGMTHNVTDPANVEDLRKRVGSWFNRYLDEVSTKGRLHG